MAIVSKDRFSGFACLYDESRPRPPVKVCGILGSYFDGGKIDAMLDLGSGTGLSTKIWAGRARRIVGIEPNSDMRAVARAKVPGAEFLGGSSYDTGQEGGSFDLVTCSQSFHWMEPGATLREVSRILKPFGVFAAYDCSWPVHVSWRSELAFLDLSAKVKELSARLRDELPADRQWPKDGHLQSLGSSGIFAYCKRLYFDNIESCDAKRFIGMALSQGSIQNLLKRGVKEILEPIDKFMVIVENDLRTEREMTVSYTMVLGVKDERGLP